jgi:hypothetical protein
VKTSVPGEEAEEPWTVRMLPAVPEAVHDVVMRWVVVPIAMVLAAVAVLLMVLKVLLPLMVRVPLPPWFRVMLV